VGKQDDFAWEPLWIIPYDYSQVGGAFENACSLALPYTPSPNMLNPSMTPTLWYGSYWNQIEIISPQVCFLL
jgi:hypothetical protein